MSEAVGRRLSLSPPRRFLCELLHFTRKVPAASLLRRMRLAEVAAARAAADPRPSWSAVFLKAFAFVTASLPELRRAYVRFPTPHLYEHPATVLTVALERPHAGEQALFFARLPQPQQHSLHELDALLRHLSDCPVEDIAEFRRALRLGRWPLPLRRVACWFGLATPARRERLLGTAGFHTQPGLSGSSPQPLALLTGTLNYGVVEENGETDVRLNYDPRVFDGGTAARALGELESVLTHEILAELRYCRGLDAA
jgi:hypothetical protein